MYDIGTTSTIYHFEFSKRDIHVVSTDMLADYANDASVQVRVLSDIVVSDDVCN